MKAQAQGLEFGEEIGAYFLNNPLSDIVKDDLFHHGTDVGEKGETKEKKRQVSDVFKSEVAKSLAFFRGEGTLAGIFFQLIFLDGEALRLGTDAVAALIKGEASGVFLKITDLGHQIVIDDRGDDTGLEKIKEGSGQEHEGAEKKEQPQALGVSG